MDLAGVVNGTLGVVCAAAVFAMSTGNCRSGSGKHAWFRVKCGRNLQSASLEYPVLCHGFQRYGGDSGILTGVTGTADRGGCTVCIYQSVVTAYLGAE